jgi:hypothetical protein
VTHSVRPLVLDLVSDLGPDVEFIRPRAGRLYLTGAEIGIYIAILIVAKFIGGYFDGWTTNQGEKLGERHAEGARRRAGEIVDRLRSLDSDDADQTLAEAERSQSEIEDLLEQLNTELGPIDGSSRDLSIDAAQVAIAELLHEMGLPKPFATRHARQAVLRIVAHNAMRRSGAVDGL